jgi:hypothetical protein
LLPYVSSCRCCFYRKKKTTYSIPGGWCDGNVRLRRWKNTQRPSSSERLLSHVKPFFRKRGQESQEIPGGLDAYLKFKACMIHEFSCENLSKLIDSTEKNPGEESTG